jgi:hypothetical protein
MGRLRRCDGFSFLRLERWDSALIDLTILRIFLSMVNLNLRRAPGQQHFACGSIAEMPAAKMCRATYEPTRMQCLPEIVSIELTELLLSS